MNYLMTLLLYLHVGWMIWLFSEWTDELCFESGFFYTTPFSIWWFFLKVWRWFKKNQNLLLLQSSEMCEPFLLAIHSFIVKPVRLCPLNHRWRIIVFLLFIFPCLKLISHYRHVGIFLFLGNAEKSLWSLLHFKINGPHTLSHLFH